MTPPAAERPRPDLDEQRRMRTFIDATTLCAAVVIAFEAVTWARLREPWLLVAMATLGALIVAGRWSLTAVARGALLPGARLMGAALLGAVVIYAMLLPPLFPVLGAVPLTVMALLLPHRRPSRRGRLLVAAWVAALAITVLGVYTEPLVGAPASFINGLIVVGVGAVNGLTLLLISQYDTRRAEQLARVAASEARLRTLVETAADGVLLVEDGVVLEANHAAGRLFGVRPAELIGAPIEHLLDRVDDDPAEGPASSLPGRTTVGHRRGGGAFPAEVSIGDTEIGPRAVRVYVVRDVTERAQATAELARRAAALARSNRELEQFAYVASHDLQEPLRKIQAFATLLDESARDRLDDEERQALDYLTDAATRQRALINDLLAYSRARTRPRVPRPVPLGEILTEVLADLDLELARTQAVLDIGPLPTIEADRGQMVQLMRNLIGNALKYAHAERRPRVTLRAEPDTLDGAPAWRIEVRDNGIGFEQRFAERIFEPFRRLHARHEYPGSGVGLAICRQIVERHQGRIAATGEPGRGATFTVLLPHHSPIGATADDDAQDPSGRDSVGG
ncbi:MAG: PAS domain S-box protein [Myxococcales bacterium]|nr:PAS domain S-box protein [Myxococcales bacterium]MCB9541640.1 PAS domain S-box protein [Myxococcales bacterium]